MRPTGVRAAAGAMLLGLLLGLLLAGCGGGSDDQVVAPVKPLPGPADSGESGSAESAGDDPGGGAAAQPRSDAGSEPGSGPDVQVVAPPDSPGGTEAKTKTKTTVIVVAQNQIEPGMIRIIPGGLDERNRVAPNTPTSVALTILDFPKVARVSLDWSIDGGKTWKAAPLSGKSTQWTAKVPGAGSGSAVSLRVTAKATTGATVEQTAIAAYGVR